MVEHKDRGGGDGTTSVHMVMPVLVAVVGLMQFGVGLYLLYVYKSAAPWVQPAAVINISAGGGLSAIGMAVTLFKRATHQTVEWFLAWRYLREITRRSRAMLFVGLSVGGVALLCYVTSLVITNTELIRHLPGGAATIRGIQATALVLAMLCYLLTFMGILLLNFSLFTSISILGVFLGTAALVVVLSVMGGFEHDLRQKILGATAHVTIARYKRAFTDYRHVVKKVSKFEEVKGLMPLIESEVMITSQTNLSGVLLKGIDPKTIGKVTDLHRYLKAGGSTKALEYLQNPAKLARLPRHRFRPLVTDPLGADTKKAKPLKPDPKKDGEPAKKQAPLKEPKIETDLLWDIEESGDEDAERPRPVYPAIIIGQELAKNLRLSVGDDVNMVAPLGGMSPAGPIPKSKPFRVAGIFFSGMYEYDTKFAYVTIPAAQKFLGFDDVITGVEIKVEKLAMATPLANKIRQALGGKAKGYDVQDWKQRNSGLFSALKLERVVMFIVLTFIVLVASFCIITTLIMVVLEKKREIAALKAMGAANRTVLRVFLYAGLYIGTIGMLVGVLTGVGICLFLAYVGLPLDPEVYYISELPVKMNARDILIVAASAEALAFVATLYPSMLAANLKPVEGLRRYTG